MWHAAGKQDTLHSELGRCSHWMLYQNDNETCRERGTTGLHLQAKGALLTARELLRDGAEWDQAR